MPWGRGCTRAEAERTHGNFPPVPSWALSKNAGAGGSAGLPAAPGLPKTSSLVPSLAPQRSTTSARVSVTHLAGSLARREAARPSPGRLIWVWERLKATPPLSARGHVPSTVPRARCGRDKAVRGLSTKQPHRCTRGPARLRHEAGACARPDLPLQLANCSLLPVPAARGAAGRCYYLLPALICCLWGHRGRGGSRGWGWQEGGSRCCEVPG